MNAVVKAMPPSRAARHPRSAARVVLGRLGYRPRTDVEVTVPVSRPRTRIVDAVIEVAAILCAAVRVLVRQNGLAPRV